LGYIEPTDDKAHDVAADGSNQASRTRAQETAPKPELATQSGVAAIGMPVASQEHKLEGYQSK